jgi:hypothetical protein
MVATADISRLQNDARARLPGAIDSQINQAMFAVFDEFFRGTNLWTETLPFAVSALANEAFASFIVVPYEQAKINRLQYVLNSGMQGMTNTVMNIPGILTVQPPPTTADVYFANVALTIFDPTDGDNIPITPPWIVTKYRQDFLDGILGWMFSQPSKPYFNERLSIYHMRRWRSAVARAKIEAARGNKYRTQAWYFPQLFAAPKRRSTGTFGSSNTSGAATAALSPTVVTTPGVYNATATDQVIEVNAAVSSIILPTGTANTVGPISIIDLTGNFTSTPCTVTVTGGKNITKQGVSSTSFVFNTNFQSARFQPIINDGYVVE